MITFLDQYVKKVHEDLLSLILCIPINQKSTKIYD